MTATQNKRQLSLREYCGFHGNTMGDIVTSGTIYHDHSSKGVKYGIKNCYRAEITIEGIRYRHRSKDVGDCEAWLKAVKENRIKPTDNKADWYRMEQRKDETVRVDEIIVSAAEESMLLYNYHQTGDLEPINNYLVSRLLPHMAWYCCHTLHFGKERTLKESRAAAALLLTRITAGKPIINMTSTCKRMLRVNKQHGSFFFYENAPERIKLYVNGINYDHLAEVWKVTRDKKL